MTSGEEPSQGLLPGGPIQDDADYHTEQVPQNLRRATARLQFSPTYVVVGVYRLLTDEKLYIPAWDKCKHGFVRGASIALVWVS